jgi:hypothetical protein
MSKLLVVDRDECTSFYISLQQQDHRGYNYCLHSRSCLADNLQGDNVGNSCCSETDEVERQQWWSSLHLCITTKARETTSVGCAMSNTLVRCDVSLFSEYRDGEGNESSLSTCKECRAVSASDHGKAVQAVIQQIQSGKIHQTRYQE